MKRIFLIFLVSVCFGMIGVVFWTSPAHAILFPRLRLLACLEELKACNADLEECEAQCLEPDPCTQIFPGDGYGNPDAFGVSGHGPALSYTDNGDGTATDDNTKFMWEVKLAADGSDGGNCNDANQANRSVHCVNNVYTWSANLPNPDGTLFTDFLVKMNNRCDGSPAAEAVSCTTDADCAGVGNGLCGHAGHRDWHIPNIKELQSIVDYGMFNPAIDSTFPGATALSFYWSATTSASIPTTRGT
jgi:hypothetical protein